jgi:tight adherence protein B
MLPRLSTSRGRRRLGAAVAGALLSLTAVSGAAAAETDEASIAYIEAEDGTLQILVSVPDDASVDLDAVKVTVGGTDAEASASIVESSSEIRRTAVLAIDTSNSMKGDRFEAAKAAALTFLDTVPDDIYVGIVTFDSFVETALAPSQDREAARSVIGGLDLRRETSLYDGVLTAVDQTGTEGQRSVLVLSDGADTTTTELSEVTAAIRTSEVRVDVAAISQTGRALEALLAMARSGGGEVYSTDPAALREAFARNAQVLANQVLVTAEVPASVLTSEAQVAVSLPSGDQVLEADAFAKLSAPDQTAVEQVFERSRGLELPAWSMYAAVAMVSAGLLALLVAVVPRPSQMTAEAVVSRYAQGTGAADAKPERDLAITQAKDAAAQMLRRNKSLEGRIAARLEAAGSQVKSAEWLLFQLAVTVIAGALGLVFGGGSLIVGLIFMALGVVLPWLWLGFRRKRRLKAFNTALPDALQLMAGSLQAGLSLAQSLDTIVREGTEPIAGEFKRVLVEARLGVSLEDSLEGVGERFQSKDFEWVVMAIKIQREVGGNLAELLNTVSDTMRERQYMRRQVAALAAEGKLSAYVLGGLPVLFMIYLVLTKREYVMPMFTEPMGWLMLGGAGVLLGVGSFWMSRLIKVEV